MKWTETRKLYLRNLVQIGKYSIADMAKMMGASYHAIAKQLQLMGLTKKREKDIPPMPSDKLVEEHTRFCRKLKRVVTPLECQQCFEESPNLQQAYRHREKCRERFISD